MMNQQILNWFAHGETGVSSEAMACVIAGIKPNSRWGAFGNHPSDPDDLKRCIRFLDAVPDARLHMDKVAKISKVWANLVKNWDELEAMFKEEFPTGQAPKTYQRMKELGC